MLVLLDILDRRGAPMILKPHSSNYCQRAFLLSPKRSTVQQE
jgi:hypothetical protein